MRKLFKNIANKWKILLINYTIITLLFLVFAPKYTLEQFINTLFYIFLICLIMRLFLYIKKGGFFDGLAFSFNRYKSMISKNVEKIDSWKEKPSPSENVNKSFYSMLAFLLFWQFALLVFLLLIYYLL